MGGYVLTVLVVFWFVGTSPCLPEGSKFAKISASCQIDFNQPLLFLRGGYQGNSQTGDGPEPDSLAQEESSERPDPTKSETPDSFALGNSIGRDVDKDALKRMTVQDLKVLFSQHGMDNLDDDSAAKILDAAKKNMMATDADKIRDDPEVNSWTGRRDDDLSPDVAEHTPQTRLPPLKRGFLTSPGSGTRKATVLHHTPSKASPVMTTPSPTKGRRSQDSSLSSKKSTPRRRKPKGDFDMEDLERLNQKISEIELKEAFVPDMPRSPRPLNEDEDLHDSEDERSSALVDGEDGLEEDEEIGLSQDELEDKNSEEMNEIVEDQLRQVERRLGLERRPDAYHPAVEGDEPWEDFEKREEKKGMGGVFWRSTLLKAWNTNETKGAEYIQQMPFHDDPEAGLLPPPKGVGDNVNHTREREEQVLAQLLACVKSNDTEGIERLYREEGANIDLRDYPQLDYGATPLEYAIEFKCEAAAFKLLELGADIGKADRLGAPPLLYCARYNGARVARELLLRGANASCQDAISGSTALHVAAGEGDNDMVEMLVDAGADVNARDEVSGETPLFDAAANGWTDTVTLLLDRGADPCATDLMNYQPYLRAQEWDRWETAQVLIKAMGPKYVKLPVNEFPPTGRTPRPGELTKPPVPGDSDYESGDELIFGTQGPEDEEEEMEAELEGNEIVAAAVNQKKQEEAQRRKERAARRRRVENAKGLH